MTRQLFMAELMKKLNRLPHEEYYSAVSFYNEYFDEAGTENEQRVIAELGSPSEAAAKILSEFAVKSTDGEKKTNSLNVLGIVLLGIFAGPVALPVAIAAFAVLLALVVSVFAVLISLGAAAVALVLSGLVTALLSLLLLPGEPASTVFFLGAGLLTAGIGAAMGIVTYKLSEVCVKGLVKLSAGLINKGRRNRK